MLLPIRPLQAQGTNHYIEFLRLMATSSTNYLYKLRATVTVILMFSLTFLPSKSVSAVGLEPSSYSDVLNQWKMVLGSRPPQCINKCMNCRPCRATLVVHHPHQGKVFRTPSQGEDEYYLLSWKCKCGDKLFQP